MKTNARFIFSLTVLVLLPAVLLGPANAQTSPNPPTPPTPPTINPAARATGTATGVRDVQNAQIATHGAAIADLQQQLGVAAPGAAGPDIEFSPNTRYAPVTGGSAAGGAGAPMTLARMGSVLNEIAPNIRTLPTVLQIEFGRLATAMDILSTSNATAIDKLKDEVLKFMKDAKIGCAQMSPNTQAACIALNSKELDIETTPHDTAQKAFDAFTDMMRLQGFQKEWKCQQVTPAGAGGNPPAQALGCGWAYTPIRDKHGRPVVPDTTMPPGWTLKVDVAVGPSAHMGGASYHVEATPPALTPEQEFGGYGSDSHVWRKLGLTVLGAGAGCGAGWAVGSGIHPEKDEPGKHQESWGGLGCAIGAATMGAAAAIWQFGFSDDE